MGVDHQQPHEAGSPPQRGADARKYIADITELGSPPQRGADSVRSTRAAVCPGSPPQRGADCPLSEASDILGLAHPRSAGRTLPDLYCFR
ncbi:hypothetical protein SSBG_06661 [Streptomyces sp. SPB074]|nr:hypothetical protein SSBG_06661 [Streptomyces sp. SPB074]